MMLGTQDTQIKPVKQKQTTLRKTTFIQKIDPNLLGYSYYYFLKKYVELKKAFGVCYSNPPEGSKSVADVLGDGLGIFRPSVINHLYGQQAQGCLYLPGVDICATCATGKVGGLV